jgi:hypothetical protein
MDFRNISSYSEILDMFYEKRHMHHNGVMINLWVFKCLKCNFSEWFTVLQYGTCGNNIECYFNFNKNEIEHDSIWSVNKDFIETLWKVLFFLKDKIYLYHLIAMMVSVLLAL